MQIKMEVTFDDLLNRCWEGAVETLHIVQKHGKEQELMRHLETYFKNGFDPTPTLTQVNSHLSFSREFVLECVGIFEENIEK